jgi:hypothetical protein
MAKMAAQGIGLTKKACRDISAGNNKGCLSEGCELLKGLGF